MMDWRHLGRFSRVRRFGVAFPYWSTAVLLCAGAWATIIDPAPIVSARESLFDLYQQIRPRPSHAASLHMGPARMGPARIIDIDDQSLAKLGQWPWPRTRLAELVDRLDRMGASVIVFDILLAEPDRSSPRPVPEAKRAQPPDADPAGLANSNDAALAAAIARARVVTGFALVPVSGASAPTVKAGFAFVDGDDPSLLPASPAAVGTLPILEEPAAGNGALSVSLSAGGVIRHIPLLLRLGDRIVPSLPAESVRVSQGANTYVVRLSPGSGGITAIRIGSIEVPTNATGHVYFYARPEESDRYIPAWKVLSGEVSEDGVRGAIALIGSTARGLYDIHRSPLGTDLPGVEFQAQLLDQLTQGEFLYRPEWAKGAEVVLTLALGAVVMGVGSSLGPMWTALVSGLGIAAAAAVSWIGFRSGGLLLDPLLPAATVVTVYLSFSLLRHLQAERERRWVRKAFSSYLSPKLVQQLVDDPSELQLHGERRDVTCVFTDLEEFTSLVERYEPAAVVPVLNRYLDGIIRIAFEHDGTVDKIIGDAVHILFGTPVAQPRHAHRGVLCALDIDRFAQAFAEEQRRTGVEFGRTRIGVNSGPAIVGNFGGELRFDYTAHGDTINTTARLEGANKFLGTRICVSEKTIRQCFSLSARPAARVLLKGKNEPLLVFEPVDERHPWAADLAPYLTAFRLLDEEDGDSAEAAFAAILARWPEDPLAAFHLRRLRAGARGSLVAFSEK